MSAHDNIQTRLARPNSPVQALQGVHISNGRVTATDTNVHVQVDLSDDATLSSVDGCVDARRLSLALSTLDGDGKLSITQSGDTLTLRCAGSRRTLKLIPGSAFPQPVWGEGEETRIDHPEVLARAIACVRHAGATTDFRPTLAGMGARNGALFCTDGFRAARMLGAAAACGIADGAILPMQVLDNLREIADAAAAAADKGGEPMFGKSIGEPGMPAKAYAVRHQRWRLQFQLIAGEPAPIDRVIPAQHSGVQFAISRADLLSACKNMARLAVRGKKVPIVRATLESGRLSVELAAGADAGEEISDSIPCEYEGVAWSCGFNPHFLIDALDALSGDPVLVSQAGADDRKPLFITGSDDRMSCVVMPHQI